MIHNTLVGIFSRSGTIFVKIKFCHPCDDCFFVNIPLNLICAACVHGRIPHHDAIPGSDDRCPLFQFGQMIDDVDVEVIDRQVIYATTNPSSSIWSMAVKKNKCMAQPIFPSNEPCKQFITLLQKKAVI